ncbi:MAG: hypothetical protein V1908_02035 [Candidatus Peregrinibacteria bacterium]
MSRGALKLADREDGQPKYLRLASRDQTVVATDDFEKVAYVASSELLTKGLGIPATAIPILNQIIGRFLVAVQEASFIRRDVLSCVSPSGCDCDCDRRETRHIYTSTLSPNTLAGVIRRDIEQLIRDIISLFPLTGETRIETTETKVAQPLQAKPSIRNEALILLNDVSHEGEFNFAELLTEEARRLIDQFGPGCANAVNRMLQNFAEAILGRADLSFCSLLCDVEDIKEGNPLGLPTNATYSTLDPVNLITISKGILEYSAPAGIVTRLPQELQDQIIARIRA